MLEFLKIFGYTILGLIAFFALALLGIWVLLLIWPLVILALPVSIIVYIGMIIYKLNKKTKKTKRKAK